MNPSSGDCIEVYDFSFGINERFGEDDDDLPKALSTFNKTKYRFCPWESNCPPGLSTSQEDRIGMTGEEITYNQAFISNTCCSGSQSVSYTHLTLPTKRIV